MVSLLLVLVGCGSTPDRSTPQGSTPTEDSAPSIDTSVGETAESGSLGSTAGTSTTAQTGATGHTGDSCAVNEVPLVTTGAGSGERYYVEVVYQGALALLQFDTGSSLSFLYTGVGNPDYVPGYGEVMLGCDTVPVAGRGYAAPPDLFGLPVIGVLGMETLLTRPSRVSVPQRTLTLTDELPAGLCCGPLPFDNVYDHALFPVELDGEPLRLMFDTGGGDTLHVGVPGRPGDAEQQVVDAEGTVFTIYTGEGELGLPVLGERTVPVARVEEFPYFAQTVQALGGNLHGLLGVTAFPGEALWFDGERSEAWAEAVP